MIKASWICIGEESICCSRRHFVLAEDFCFWERNARVLGLVVDRKGVLDLVRVDKVDIFLNSRLFGGRPVGII
jgi:hypothetical protein